KLFHTTLELGNELFSTLDDDQPREGYTNVLKTALSRLARGESPSSRSLPPRVVISQTAGMLRTQFEAVRRATTQEELAKALEPVLWRLISLCGDYEDYLQTAIAYVKDEGCGVRTRRQKLQSRHLRRMYDLWTEF